VLEKSASPSGATDADAARPVPSRRILVVDDNVDSASTLGTLLKFLGADVHVAHDGLTALSTLERIRPDVVLLDIGMPGMDGFEVARRIRERDEFNPVILIALTGWGQEGDRRRTQEAGFDHHLVKPADIVALQALLVKLD
jgi:CheY-like chemotaxis protein